VLLWHRPSISLCARLVTLIAKTSNRPAWQRFFLEDEPPQWPLFQCAGSFIERVHHDQQRRDDQLEPTFD
jgi:hypothetical protein